MSTPHSDTEDHYAPSFAPALRAARAHAAARLGSPIEPETLAACFGAAGYALDAGAYTAIEEGRALPLDLLAFVEAAVHCLGLARRERDELLRRLAVDVLCAALGEDLARQILRPAAD